MSAGELASCAQQLASVVLVRRAERTREKHGVVGVAGGCGAAPTARSRDSRDCRGCRLQDLQRREAMGTFPEGRGQLFDQPTWLGRITAAGGALGVATAFAAEANVIVCARKGDAEAVATCEAIERASFDKNEAMHIAHEVGLPWTTLLCASPILQDGIADDTFSRPEFRPREACVVGYAVLQEFRVTSNAFAALQPPSVLLAKLAVEASRRRRGIGKALLAAAVGHAHARRATTVKLHVDEANLPARVLYASMGFVVEGERLEDYYETGRHAIEMVLDLAPSNDIVVARNGNEMRAS